LFGNTYNKRRVLLTGHTGFKGSWLALWLRMMGAEVTGLALDPETTPSHWDLLDLDMRDYRVDIRDHAALDLAVKVTAPEIIFHMAAQPLVRRSYRQPRETWEANVMGTVNLLDSCRALPGLRAIVIITTDKCYENRETGHAYNEGDRLGGHDPYSASKAGTELAAASFRDSFFHADGAPLLATARAGNVIGGGDWSEDRLIPDLARAQAAGQSLGIRSPNATRPWQHVLEPLSGYLQLGQRLLAGNRACATAWNFGPDANSALSVSALLDRMKAHWPGAAWHIDGTPSVHEAGMLQLDSGKAHRELKWRPVMTLDQQLEITAEWYRAYGRDNKAVLTADQLNAYTALAAASGASWC
jgi:CDP-glucose 4,6-dehydratase